MAKSSILFLLLCILAGKSWAQEERFRWVSQDTLKIIIDRDTDTLHMGKVYIGSGSLGFGIPLGRTNDLLSTSLAGNWGVDISLPNRNMLLYPSIDYLRFNYNQLMPDPDYEYMVENGNATFTNVNLSVGVRNQWSHLNTYFLAGPSVGLFREPRTTVHPETSIARNELKNSLIFGARIGMGADYKFKGFYVFADMGLLQGFREIQERPLSIMTVYVGLKTDITRVADKVVETVFERN